MNNEHKSAHVQLVNDDLLNVRRRNPYKIFTEPIIITGTYMNSMNNYVNNYAHKMVNNENFGINKHTQNMYENFKLYFYDKIYPNLEHKIILKSIFFISIIIFVYVLFKISVNDEYTYLRNHIIERIHSDDQETNYYRNINNDMNNFPYESYQM